MIVVSEGLFFLPRQLGVLSLLLIALPALSAGTPPAERTELAPSAINDIESSVSSGQADSKDGLVVDQKRSVIENVKVGKSAQPTGDNKLEQGEKFRLNGIQLQGNTVMDKDSIIFVVQPYVGTMMTTADLQAVASQITQLFVEQGYATTKCVIPAQKVTDGVVVLKVVEDKLGQIQLSGAEPYFYDVRLFLAQLHDLQGEVIHLPTLNSRLRHLSQLPATRVQPTLVKQSEGTTNLVLKLTDLEDQFSVSVNNSGSRFTGANRLSSSAVFNNVSGNSDVATVAFTTSLNNVKYLGSMSLNYKRPVGSSGGKMGVGYSNLYYRMDPSEVGFDQVRYEGGTNSLALRYEQPLWLEDESNSQKNYNWSVGFERKKAQAKTIYNTSFDQPAGFAYVDSEDRLMVGDITLYTEQYTLLKGLKGRSFASISLKHAFEGFFGATTQEDIDRKLENISNNVEPITGPIGNVTGMDPNFWKLYVDVSRAQTLPNSFNAQFDFHGEYTPSKKLPQSYQFAGADGGASGFSLGLKLMRPIAQNVSIGVAFKHSKAVSWYRDVDPGCNNSVGTATAISAGRNSCSTNEMELNLDWRLGSLLTNVNYRNNITSSAQNNNKVTFNFGYRW
jgi:hemolysin activation/secretion protein|tara:strand:+ start:55 stop:1905 length:1851 start_codon:yes stop_codon:yes gene_type:complete